jgi:microcystin-dependent protein
MSDPFLGEIKIFSFPYAPRGWALCNGQLMPISQNQALFSLLGTYYGGNGSTTFALPNLQGRASMHMGDGRVIGQQGGEAFHTLTPAEVAAHSHGLRASNNNANLLLPNNAIPARVASPMYSAGTPTSQEISVAMHPLSIATAGGSQPHENRQPYLTLNICIALTGIYPSRN